VKQKRNPNFGNPRPKIQLDWQIPTQMPVFGTFLSGNPANQLRQLNPEGHIIQASRDPLLHSTRCSHAVHNCFRLHVRLLCFIAPPSPPFVLHYDFTWFWPPPSGIHQGMGLVANWLGESSAASCCSLLSVWFVLFFLPPPHSHFPEMFMFMFGWTDAGDCMSLW